MLKSIGASVDPWEIPFFRTCKAKTPPWESNLGLKKAKLYTVEKVQAFVVTSGVCQERAQHE